MFLLTSNTESCEEDDEVGVAVVEEELVDKPGTTNGTWFGLLQSIIHERLPQVAQNVVDGLEGAPEVGGCIARNFSWIGPARVRRPPNLDTLEVWGPASRRLL